MMDDFITSCIDFKDFPCNLCKACQLDHALLTYQRLINDEASRLFIDTDCEHGLSIWDLEGENRAYILRQGKNLCQLKAQLGVEPGAQKSCPNSRFIFVHAENENSHAALDVTQDMLMFAMSYLQAMPEFLDYLSLFGLQEQAEDLYCSGFQESSRLRIRDQGLSVPELSLSGFQFEFCYNLKSMEHSPGQPQWPWSIRQYAIHHTFDLEYIRSTWLIIKGNRELEKRIRAVTSPQGRPTFSSYDSLEAAFAATLLIHVLVCEMAAENWRWYCKFLEQEFEKLTKATIVSNVDLPVDETALSEMDAALQITRRNTSKIEPQRTRARTLSFTIKRPNSSVSIPVRAVKSPTQETMTTASGKRQPRPPGRNSTAGPRATPRFDKYGQKIFAFADLQDIQNLEEKANECNLVLRLNSKVLQQLQDHYTAILDTAPTHSALQALKSNCASDVDQFQRQLRHIQQEMELQILRYDALLRRLADRKTLLYGILEYQNTQVNKTLAWSTHGSNMKMERMTRDMGKIARKTKTETVSMKIITLVTLFFLPGTFFSVGYLLRSHLTLMSTDIVHWNDNKRDFSWDALRVYLYLSVPFTVLVLLIWAIYSYSERQRARNQQKELDADDVV